MRKNTSEPKGYSVKATLKTPANFLCAVFAPVCIQSTVHPLYDFRGLLWSFMWHCLCEECLWYIVQQCCQHNKCVLIRSSKLKCRHSDIAYLRQQCHNSKFVILQGKILKVLKRYNFLWVQRRHNCSPAASFANCVMTLYLLKVHLQTFLSMQITQICQVLSCDTFVANGRYARSVRQIIVFSTFMRACEQLGQYWLNLETWCWFMSVRYITINVLLFPLVHNFNTLKTYKIV